MSAKRVEGERTSDRGRSPQGRTGRDRDTSVPWSAPSPGKSGYLHSRVALVRRYGNHALVGEGLLLGVFAGFTLIWLALISGASDVHGAPLTLACVGAIMVSILWYWERTRGARFWARRIDQRLRLRGGFLAGLQAERSESPSEIGSLLIAELRQRVTRKELLTQAVPVHLWILALPFLSGALLLNTVQASRAPATRWTSTTPMFQELHSELAAAAKRMQPSESNGNETNEAQPGASDDPAQAVADIALQARDMGREMIMERSDTEAWADTLREMRERLDEVAENVVGDPELDASLERAQGLLSTIEERAREQEGNPFELDNSKKEEPDPSDVASEKRDEGGISETGELRDSGPELLSNQGSTQVLTQATEDSGPGVVDPGRNAGSVGRNPGPRLESAQEKDPIADQAPPSEPTAFPSLGEVRSASGNWGASPQLPRGYRGLVGRWLAGKTWESR